MHRSYRPIRQQTKQHSKRHYFLLILITLVALAVGWAVFASRQAKAPTSNQEPQTSTTNQQQSDTTAYKSVNLQPAVDNWVNNQVATYSIVVYDPQSKQIIGQHLADDVYFAASLYKIYVAYLALVDFQSGAQDPNDIIWNGTSRITCVDKMIRESHSPCGEAMMAEMGQAKLNERVKNMGMTGTYFNGIRTSAKDSALILQYILEARDLDKENTNFLLNAMEIQDDKFRQGLAKGAPSAKWQTKVGWNLDENYHDIGIMTMPDGRKYAVAILSEGNGSPKPIASFASSIYSELSK